MNWKTQLMNVIVQLEASGNVPNGVWMEVITEGKNTSSRGSLHKLHQLDSLHQFPLDPFDWGSRWVRRHFLNYKLCNAIAVVALCETLFPPVYITSHRSFLSRDALSQVLR